MGMDVENRPDSPSSADGAYLGASLSGKGRARPVRRPHGDEEWRIEDHVCRVCFCRVLSRHGPGDTGRIYRCSSCGIEGIGHAPSVICSCGLKFKNGHNLGVRCIINDAPTPEAPAEVVARQVVT